MIDFLKNIFTADFMPHGRCMFWDPGVVWLHVICDGVTALAYYSIPAILIYFTRKRKDLVFKWVFVAFGIFILACGTTHIMDIITMWIPVYRLDGLIRLVTALSSIMTAILLVPLIPKVLELPSPLRLQQILEETKRTLETNYREIFDKANDAIYIHDVETGKILDVNQRTCDLFGYTREDFIQGDPNQFMTGNPGYALEDALRWLKKAATEGPQVFEWQGKNKDGSYRWVEVSLKRAIIAGQDRLLAFVRDISDRRKLAEVVENRNFVNAILENIPNMIFVKDAKELRFVNFNKAGEDLLGIPRSEMIGKNDYDFFPKADADFFVSKDRKTLEDGKLVDIPEETLQTRQGPRILHTKKFPVMGVDGKPLYLLGISDDITDLKRQQELEVYARALEVSNRELQDFVFVASHDLQEPLRKVLSFGEFLQEEYGGKLDETGRDYLDRIRSAASRMQVLINDLLTLTRVTTKAKPFELVDLNKVLKEVLSDLEVRVQEKEAKMEIGPLPTLEADPTQMRQLFQNLIGNALKFHRPGVPPEVRVEADAGTEGRLCRIWVRDNGIGFDNKYAEQIFKVFERLHGRDEYEGTGIGLAVCRKVVERHKGFIIAEGFPGQGSTFTVSLPLRQNPKGGKP